MIQKKLENVVLYKYLYQDYNKQVYMYNRAENTEDDNRDINKFIDNMDKDETVSPDLKEYIKLFYASKQEDGQTQVDYMINRCESIYGRNEMEISWKKHGSSL